MPKKKQQKTVAQQEAEMEREGQTTLPTMPHHSRRGGARKGSGPKSQALGGKARSHSIWCSDVEYNELMRHLKYWRKAHARDYDDSNTVASYELPSASLGL